jgi:phage terminase large subunit
MKKHHPKTSSQTSPKPFPTPPEAFKYQDFLEEVEEKIPKNITELMAELFPNFVLKPWQQRELEYIFQNIWLGQEEKKCTRLAIAGGHEIGKTTFDCLVLLLHLYYCGKYKNAQSYRAAVVSGRAEQLVAVIIAELRQLSQRCTYNFYIDTQKIAYDDNHIVRALVCNANNPQSILGLHGENVMVIFDEGGAIHYEAYDKVPSFFSGAVGLHLVTGNPYVTSGPFYNLFSNPVWKAIHISRDVTDTKDNYINDIVAQFGIDSDHYRVKILGQFPLSETGCLFPRFLVEAAVGRYNFMRYNPPEPICFGIDIASGEGADFSVLVVRGQDQVYEIVKKKCRFKEFFDIIMEKFNYYRPMFMGVDRNGVGHNIAQDLYNMLRHKCRVHNIISCPIKDLRCHDMRTYLYSELRDWLEYSGAIPNDPELIEELKGILVEELPSGKRKAVPKKELNIKSPDMVDALAYSFISPLHFF